MPGFASFPQARVDATIAKAPAKPALKEDAIRTIDLSSVLKEEGVGEEEMKKIAREWLAAAEEIGFAYMNGYQSIVPDQLVREAFKFSEAFFELPFEAKDELRYTSSEANRGFIAAERSLKNEDSSKGQKETFEMGNDAMPEFPEHWPDEGKYPSLKGFKETFTTYHRQFSLLHEKIMSLLAVSLSLPSTYFDPYISERAHHIRLLHYPPRPRGVSTGEGRFGAHCDIGTTTLLFQDDIGGLEVYRESDQSWVPIPPKERTFVINIGDILKVWSNGKLKSTLHRTNMPTLREGEDSRDQGAARRSIAFFANPDRKAVIDCLPGCGEPKYEAFVAKEYYTYRLGPAVDF